MSSQIEVLNPATGLSIGMVDNASISDCLQAVDMAHDAFVPWKNTAPRVRAEILRKAFDIMIAEQEELARTITLEMGKVLSDARAEVAYAAEFFRWFSEEAVRIDGDYRRAPSGSNWLLVSCQPVGVALLATPWNFPAAMATRKIGPALAAGCTAVLKVAHQTSLVHQMVLECLTDISSLPQDIVCSFVEDGSDISKRMCEHPLIDVISFTGSSQTGKKIAASSSGTLKRLSLELGGKAPAIVLSDVKVDAAVNQLVAGALPMAGQQCTAIARILIDNTRFDEVSQRLVSALSAIKLGPGADLNSQMGPLIDIANRDRIARLIDSAKTQGKVHLEGRVPSGVLSNGASVTPTLVEKIGRAHA